MSQLNDLKFMLQQAQDEAACYRLKAQALEAQLHAEEKRNRELIAKLNAQAPMIARLEYLEREMAKEAQAEAQL
jgi:hypothetical protein